MFPVGLLALLAAWAYTTHTDFWGPGLNGAQWFLQLLNEEEKGNEIKNMRIRKVKGPI